MKLSLSSLCNRKSWDAMGIILPAYDVPAMVETTRGMPRWLHMGGGNIFRAYIASIQQELLNAGHTDTGIIAAESYDDEIIPCVYDGYDNLSISISWKPGGGMDKTVVGSVASAIPAMDQYGFERLKRLAAAPSLQIISFTITEKGYMVVDPTGQPVPAVRHDLADGPDCPTSVMGMAAALLLERYNSGGMPVALLSLDNVSHNGDALRDAILRIAKAWEIEGAVKPSFINYLMEPDRVSFPFSMIDKITPQPSETVRDHLANLGIEDMHIIRTCKNTFTAPFVNSEAFGLLVIEDAFPNGRPPLERAGVYMTDRNTVIKAERMKVCTCLNPLHTAMGSFGCLLGHTSIAECMEDADIRELVERVGSSEGMPVVTNPGIIDPTAFLRQVIDERLTNPNIPDTPERMTVDQSMMMSIRFGETLKAYARRSDLRADDLSAIPLAIAGWLRYLLGIDDNGTMMVLSPDPYAALIVEKLGSIVFGQPGSYTGQLTQVLNNERLFGCNLYTVGIGETVERLFISMIESPGAVRSTLHGMLTKARDMVVVSV